MNTQHTPRRRSLKSSTAVFCALLDAFAIQMDLKAAAGRQPLLRTPLAISSRTMATIIRRWSISWIGAVFGLGWIVHTFREGSRSPDNRS